MKTGLDKPEQTMQRMQQKMGQVHSNIKAMMMTLQEI